MGSIGNFDFLQMTGPQIPALASAVEIIDRAGTDGIASRVDALKAEEITIYTIEGVQQLNTANARADSYAALKGTHITVVDDLGRQTEEVLVVDVRVTNVRGVLKPRPANNNYLVNAVWLLKPTKV